jgi:glutaredoxin 3
MAEVIVYSKAVCPYCDRAKMLLKAKDVAFEERRVDLDPALLDEMLSKSEGRRTVPQIFINDQGVGGFDDLWALEQKGQLDSLLK